MAKEEIVQTYAQAIFDQAVEGWYGALKSVSASLEKSGLAEKLDNSSTPFAKKEELLHGIVPANTKPEVGNFIKLLASKNQIRLLPQVVAEFDRRVQQGPQSRTAQVTSAIKLIDAEKRKLESKLQAKFGRDTSFDYAINPDILGGVIVRVGDKVLDGSVSGKLAALKEKLTS